MSASRALLEWRRQLQAELHSLESKLLLRQLHVHQGRLDFSSNDYLSLNSSGKLQQWLRQTVLEDESNFVGSTGSRLIRGHYSEFEELEAQFAAWSGSEAALFFHTGYGANVGAISALCGARDQCFVDRLCHASILDGVRLAGAERIYFEHNDLDDLQAKLARRRSRGRAWIMTESIFSMDGDRPQLPALCNLAAKYDALLLLDEAHAVGLRGKSGAGLASECGLISELAVVVTPCGKAPGLMGAFVSGPLELKAWLTNKARSFVFSTAQPPLLARLMAKVIRYLESEECDLQRRRLQGLADRLRAGARQRGYNCGKSDTQIVPLIIGDEERSLAIARSLQAAGLDVRAIRPPTVPRGSSRLRVCVQAGHSDADVNELLAALPELPPGQ
ncbi:MAG: 8-amino-7-oxononanoate synthase [Leptospirales bacterium]|nr:8-amino-7-oxononanoate synthase [Leptospirales bacterium]